MTTAFLLLAVAALAYAGLVRHEMRRVPAVRYNRVVARVLRAVLPARMRCLSLWRTAWMLYPPTDRRGTLSYRGRIHEVNGHILNPSQWAGYPYTFPVRYLWRLWRYGYDQHPDEQQARQIAGEPTR